MEFSIPGQAGYEPGLYEASLQKGYDLIKRPQTAPGVYAVRILLIQIRKSESDRN